MNLSAPLPPDFLLSRDFIDVWIVPTSLDAGTMAALGNLLSRDERERIARIRIAAKQREALVSRGILRLLLGAVLKQGGPALPLAVGPHGKPFLEGARGYVKFNVSHTAGRIMVAITRDHELGADIETIDSRRSHIDLAQRYFTDNEAAAIVASSERERAQAFFTCWCRKEAVLKATGLGIAAGLRTFEVPVCALSSPIDIERQDGNVMKHWRLHDVPAESPYVASIAVESCDAAIRRHSL